MKVVTYTFVSSKKKRTNEVKFGFIRFAKRVDVIEALKKNDGLVIKGKKMRITIAKYSRENRDQQGGNEEALG